MIRLIAAIDRQRGIAKHGYLPWYIPEDEKYFTDQTKLFGGNVLTGGVTFRNTYHNRPLAGRQNFILTHSTDSIEGASAINDIETFLSDFHADLWVAGGSGVFEQVMANGLADELYLTHIDADFGCDQFFPDYESGFKLLEQSGQKEQNGFNFRYARYKKA